MKIVLIQPPYSSDFSKAEEYLKWELDELDKIDDTADLVILPESSDVPAFANKEQAFYAFEHYQPVILEKCLETAKRAHTMLFFNADDYRDGMHLNTTYAVNREGEIVGKYYKVHPTPGESKSRGIDHGYVTRYEEPTIVEMEGLRFAFLTCYDFYFYENCGQLARMKPDVIIGCSHQRTDKQNILEMMSVFYAYNTNAFVIRSSVSMGEEETVGGCSMVVAPDGTVLLNMLSRTGAESIEADLHEKYLKPAGYKKPLASHPDYIEAGRRAYKYRPAGPGICLDDETMPYPRVCAHRGFNSVCPENSLPAYGAAVALGAQEIEFDLWYTKDGEIVSTHDKRLERTSNGEGYVFDHTLEELKKLDFGSAKDKHFKGLPIMTFEEVLEKFACRVIMNIHVKSVGNTEPLPEAHLKKIIGLIDKYDCRKYVYFMTGNDTVLGQLRDLAPDITRCCGGGDDPFGIVERAIRYECKKVQLFKPQFNQDTIAKAKAAGLIINVFWSDQWDEIRLFLNMGIDTILSNDFLMASRAVKKHMDNPMAKPHSSFGGISEDEKEGKA